MSILTDLNDAKLLVLEGVKTPSGATKKSWVDNKDIKISIHKVSEFYNPYGLKNIEVTHIGLTFERGIFSKKHRIRLNGVVYEVVSSDDTHRLTHLTLKELVNE